MSAYSMGNFPNLCWACWKDQSALPVPVFHSRKRRDTGSKSGRARGMGVLLRSNQPQDFTNHPTCKFISSLPIYMLDGLLHEEINITLGTVCSYLEELYCLANDDFVDEFSVRSQFSLMLILEGFYETYFTY